MAATATKSFWQEVVDAFDADIVGTEAASRNRIVAAHGEHRSRSRTSIKGVTVALSLDGANKAWLSKSMTAHNFSDISRTARMVLDYVAQEGAPADVFTASRIAAKATRSETADVELVLDRSQVDWLDRVISEHGLADRNHALAVALDFAQGTDSALIFRIDRSKTRGPRNPSVMFTIKS